MPRQELGQSKDRADTCFPAMPQTLQHLVSVALQHNPKKENIVRAFECDPRLLLHALSLAPTPITQLSQWHEQFQLPMLRAAALSAVWKSPKESDGSWQDALKRSLLAEAMAQHIDACNKEEARLAALLSSLNNEKALVETLSRLGCQRATCDAIRYQSSSAKKLTGTYPIVQIIVLAGLIAEQKIDAVPPQMDTLVSLDQGVLANAIHSANVALVEQRSVILDASPIDEAIADAYTSAAFYHAIANSEGTPTELIAQSARSLTGVHRLCHFEVSGTRLTTLLDGTTVTIDQDTKGSEIAKSYREHQVLTVSRKNSDLVLEKQLLDWLGADRLLCLPLNETAGLLVLALDDLEISRIRLDALADAASDLHKRFAEESIPKIEVSSVKQQAREITHEVNNPLAIMQNYLHALALKIDDDSKVQKEIETLLKELKRVTNIVQKYAQIGTPRTLLYRATDLNEIIRDLVDIVRASTPDIDIELQLDDSIPEIEMAEDAIKQVLLNILKNACEAVEESGAARIVVRSEGAVNVNGMPCLEVVISDNGPGMTHDQRLNLFNSPATSKGDGRGLGLGIVRQLLSEMDGSISCRSNGASGGSSFQILIPVGIPSLDPNA